MNAKQSFVMAFVAIAIVSTFAIAIETQSATAQRDFNHHSFFGGHNFFFNHHHHHFHHHHNVCDDDDDDPDFC